MAKKKHKHMSSRKLVGYIMLAVAFIAPLSNLPQIYKLFTLQVTEGLSVETWIMYLVLTVVQLAYAYVNNIRPLIISNILWIIVDLIMIYGIVAFGISSSPPEYEQLLLANNIGKAMGGLALLMISSAAALFAYDLMHVDQPKTKHGKHKYAS